MQDRRGMSVGIDRASVVEVLTAAGCLAPVEEAAELIRVANGDADMLAELVDRRSKGEPIAWLTGTVTFCGISLLVEPGVYVPRHQTEPLAERAAALLPAGGVAVDLCTGIGAVARVLSARVPTSRVLATEIDGVAVGCARRNGVEVFAGSLDEPLPVTVERRVDVMTAVVPYVPTDSIRLLPADVQAFEPRAALDGGADGTDLLDAVVARSPGWLRQGGWLLLELGGDQADGIAAQLRRLGFDDPEIMTDSEGDLRGICARFRSGDRR